MNLNVTLFLPSGNADDLQLTLKEFDAADPGIRKFLLAGTNAPVQELKGTETIRITSLFASDTFRKIAIHAKSDYILIYTKSQPIRLGAYGIERMIQVADYTSAGMVYSDYYAVKNRPDCAEPRDRLPGRQPQG